MGGDAIIDGGTLGKREIMDTAPSCSSTVDTFFNCTKGTDVELWETGYLENSRKAGFVDKDDLVRKKAFTREVTASM
jgi:hypothetical protein